METTAKLLMLEIISGIFGLTSTAAALNGRIQRVDYVNHLIERGYTQEEAEEAWRTTDSGGMNLLHNLQHAELVEQVDRLDKNLYRWKGAIAAVEPSNPESIKPDINESTIDIFLGEAVTDLSNEEELAKKVLVRDEYSGESDITVPDLEVVDPVASDINESTGFDPYDTAVLQRKGYDRSCIERPFGS